MKRLDDIRVAQPKPTDVVTGVLWVEIPYTTPELTGTALNHVAGRDDLNVHVSLVDVQVVPFPCSLDEPPLNREFSERRLQTLISHAGLPGRAVVLYARDWIEGFHRVLEPGSLVLMGIQRHWWPTRESRLANALSNAGHQVVLLPAMR